MNVTGSGGGTAGVGVGWGGTVVRLHSLIIDVAGGRVDGRSVGWWHSTKVALTDRRHSTWRGDGGWREDGRGWGGVGWYSGKAALTDHRHSRGGWQELGGGGTVVMMHSLITDVAGGGGGTSGVRVGWGGTVERLHSLIIDIVGGEVGGGTVVRMHSLIIDVAEGKGGRQVWGGRGRVKAALTDHRRSRGRGTAACRCRVQPPSCRPGCPQWLDRSCPAIAGRRRNKFRQKQEDWDSGPARGFHGKFAPFLFSFLFPYGRAAVIKRHYPAFDP